MLGGVYGKGFKRRYLICIECSIVNGDSDLLTITFSMLIKILQMCSIKVIGLILPNLVGPLTHGAHSLSALCPANVSSSRLTAAYLIFLV